MKPLAAVMTRAICASSAVVVIGGERHALTVASVVRSPGAPMLYSRLAVPRGARGGGRQRRRAL